MRRVTTVTNVFTTPPHENWRRPRNTAGRARGARAGRLLPGPPHRTQGDHRHLLHRAGPGLGGTRFYPYGSEDEALADVLRLSTAMAYKNALAGLDHGGGKAVIIGDPAQIKTEPLLRAYGRFVASLGGRYVTGM